MLPQRNSETTSCFVFGFAVTVTAQSLNSTTSPMGPSYCRQAPALSICYIRHSITARACGAVGSALPWHGRGREFESHQVHHSIQKRYSILLRIFHAIVPFASV